MGQKARCSIHFDYILFQADLSKVDPKWLYWARTRLLDIESLLKANRADQRHKELLSMVGIALRFSEEHYATTIAGQQSIVENANELRVSYDDLWTLFQPNVLVTGADKLLSHSRVWCVNFTAYRAATPLEDACCRIWALFEVWNGVEYGRAVDIINIHMYSGAKPLSELPVSPLYLTQDKAGIKQRILERSVKQLNLHREPNTLQQYTGNGMGIVLNKEREPYELEKFYVGCPMAFPAFWLTGTVSWECHD